MNNATGKQIDLRSLIQSEKIQNQLAMALPSFYTPEQFGTIIRTSINRNPKLMDCTKDSFLVACLTAAQMGIAPDGRHGHLIPRWNGRLKCMEVRFQDDYKGLIQLVRRNPNVADVYAELVRENDQFAIRKGLHRDLVHDINIRVERGPIIGAYGVILYKDQSVAPSFEFMAIDEIYNIRERSDSWKAYSEKKTDSTPWVTDEGEMCKKTVLRRLFKTADLSQDIGYRLAISPDESQPPTDRAQEIKPARVNYTPRQIENGNEDEVTVDTTETEPEPTPPTERPKRGRPRKTAPKENFTLDAEPDLPPEPPADIEPSGKIETRADLNRTVKQLLDVEGFTVEQLAAAAVDNGWGLREDQRNAPISEMGEDLLYSLVDNWESQDIRDMIRNAELNPIDLK